jgi:hypothetical protein
MHSTHDLRINLHYQLGCQNCTYNTHQQAALAAPKLNRMHGNFPKQTQSQLHTYRNTIHIQVHKHIECLKKIFEEPSSDSVVHGLAMS